MPEPNPDRMKAFPSTEELHKWFEQHHNLETELWVKIYKKASGYPSVTWNDVVLESLCWGWIDGIKKSIDEIAYVQRITPRKTRSAWSKQNCKNVETLIAEGKMQKPGLMQAQAAQKDGRWANAYLASEMEIPDDFLAAVERNPPAKSKFDTLTKSNRYVIALGLTSAKRAETRSKRFNKYLDALVRGEKPS